MIPAFLFATGIENSALTLHQGQVRIDEMEKCGHYDQWRVDFDRVQELTIFGDPASTILQVVADEHVDLIWSVFDPAHNAV